MDDRCNFSMLPVLDDKINQNGFPHQSSFAAENKAFVFNILPSGPSKVKSNFLMLLPLISSVHTELD